MNYFSRKVIEQGERRNLFTVPKISVNDARVGDLGDGCIRVQSKKLNKQHIQPKLRFNLLNRFGKVLFADLQITGWCYASKSSKTGECVMVLKYAEKVPDMQKYYSKKLRLMSTQTMPLLAKLLEKIKNWLSFLQN